MNCIKDMGEAKNQKEIMKMCIPGVEEDLINYSNIYKNKVNAFLK